MTEQRERIANCPECGSKIDSVLYCTSYPGGAIKHYYVVSCYCNARNTTQGRTRQSAINKWNKAAKIYSSRDKLLSDNAALVAEVKRLKAELGGKP